MTPPHARSGALAQTELEQRIDRGEVIPQAESCADKQVPGIVWDQYGIPATNEVAVVARCGALKFFAAAPSYFLIPAMADRIFGLDPADAQLGHELAEFLWDRHAAELLAEAQRIGQARP